TISGTNLAIRANTNPSVVGSVFLQISGPVNASRTENVVVYALFGNSGSNYFGQLFPVGSYTMTATAYSGFGLSGTNLGSLTIQFDVVNGGAKQAIGPLESVSLYPNPTKEYTHIIPDQENIKIISVRVFDPSGRIIKQLDKNVIHDRNSMLLSTVGLEEGIYYLTIVTSTQNIFYKSLIVDKH
ncbi:MAG: T9SS type A sorting domain-containing protein, partial [Flavobacteriaceae bacterium]|nr:T9SS type A sorting domain-containing protein [Flavobacteriaceae bacterium]